MNQTIHSTKIRLLTMTALFTAMITVSILVIHIPIGAGGIIHVGDAVIFLAACVLPLPYALIAASLGGGLANLHLGFLATWLPFTMIIKPLLVFCFRREGQLICGRNFLALAAAAVISMGGYYLAGVVIFGNWISPIYFIPGNLIQSIGSTAVFIIIAVVFDRMKVREKLFNIK